MAMPWTLARDFTAAASRIERERLMHAAIAARAAQAEEKGWKDWLKSISA
jgi:hypothetical protein